MRKLLAAVAFSTVFIASPEPIAAQDLSMPVPCPPRAGEGYGEAQDRCNREREQNYAIARTQRDNTQIGKQMLAVVRSKPNLPTAKNGLIGRWQAPRRPKVNENADFITGLMGGLKMFEGGLCTLMFGDGGQIEFYETGWASTDSLGRDDLGRVTYKDVGQGMVGVLPAQGLENMIFEFDGPNQIRLITDTEGCNLTRIGAPPPAAAAAAAPAGPPRAAAPGSQLAFNAPPPSMPATGGRPPPEICRRAFVDELGRARIADVRAIVAQRFKDSQDGKTPGSQNLRLMARGSPCEDTRIGGVIYDFDQAGVLRQVIYAWQRPQTTFAETVTTMGRYASAPLKVAGGHAEGAGSLYRFTVDDLPAQQVVMVTYTALP